MHHSKNANLDVKSSLNASKASAAASQSSLEAEYGSNQMHEKTVSEVFGEIVWLMSRSEEHKHNTIGSLERTTMPGVLLRQFKMYYNNNLPFAVVIYALVNDHEYDTLIHSKHNIGSGQWKTGNRFLEISTVAPFGSGDDLCLELQNEINRIYKDKADA